MEHCGLGNALLSLGTPLPRYKRQAVKVEALYLKYLYEKGIYLSNYHGFDVISNPQWLDNPAREVTCLAHAKIWLDVKVSAPNAGIENLAHGMMMIYSADKPMVIRNVFGTKCLMTAKRLLDGEPAAHATINDLKDYLRKELDNV